MAKSFDITLKHIVDRYPGDWARLAGFEVDDALQPLDAGLATIAPEADRVFRVAADVAWILHLEFQSSYDPDLPRRVHAYNTMVEWKYGLPVRSIVLLLRCEADGPAMGGVVEKQLPGDSAPYVLFRFGVLRVWEMAADELLGGGLGNVPLATLTNDAESKIGQVVLAVNNRLDVEQATSEVNSLRAATYVLLIMGLRYSDHVILPLMQERSKMRESSTYQAILEEGREEGREEVREEQTKTLIFRAGMKRLGRPDVETREQVESIEDLGRLERMFDKLDQAAAWRDVLATE